MQSKDECADVAPPPAMLVRIPARPVRSRHGGVSRAIGIDIVAGRYPAGCKLPGDAELTARFAVSRPVLREGIKTLVAKGLLTSKARVGTVVCAPAAWNMFDPDILAWRMEVGINRPFLEELAEIRLAVEPNAAALAAGRRTRDDLAQMRRNLARMRHEASASPGFADGDLGLHVAVANASCNGFMRSLGAVIEAALRVTFQLSAPTGSGEREATLAAHQRIVDAIEDGDARAAATAMTGVIVTGAGMDSRVSRPAYRAAEAARAAIAGIL